MVVRLTRRPLSVAAVERHLGTAESGGVVVFAGRVRPDRRGGRRVLALDYEVDLVPALARLHGIEREAGRRFGARSVVLWHRLGRVPVGEIAVVVAATCRHRAEAFDAARYLIDELKATVPIWKLERERPARRPRRRRGRPAGRSAG
jgi:molybdopterin synthase catalytic subunit